MQAMLSLLANSFAWLTALGDNLALARQRRIESLRTWAVRMSVSVPTLMRMEHRFVKKLKVIKIYGSIN